ncbi:hypothetical protein ABK040_006128 [Willaertia magna]
MSNNNYSDQYEEPSPNYKFLDEDKWRTSHAPLRLRKNPLEVEPCVQGKCTSANQYIEFKTWMAREWSVYVAEVELLRRDVEKCWFKHGVDVIRHCKEEVLAYSKAINEKTIRENMTKLREGKKIVE